VWDFPWVLPPAHERLGPTVVPCFGGRGLKTQRADFKLGI